MSIFRLIIYNKRHFVNKLNINDYQYYKVFLSFS